MECYNNLNLENNLILDVYSGGIFVCRREFHNVTGSAFAYSALYSLITQNPFPKVTAIAVGEKVVNSFIKSYFCGTTPYGTIGNLVQSYTWGGWYATFTGSISITGSINITDIQIGSAYLGTGQSNLMHYVYAYKTGINSYYYAGDVIVVRWYLGFIS